MKGYVYKSTGNWYIVKLEKDIFVKARIKGVLKIDDTITTTNPVAVGDKVWVEQIDNDFAIYYIEDRKNVIIRKAVKKSKERHILTSNIDQILIIAALKNPFTQSIFIDKILVTAAAYHIPAMIVFNKIDLYNQKLLEKVQAYKTIYTRLNYPVFSMSIECQQGIEILESLLSQKKSLLIGYSGAGKTSLLNILLPNKNLRTQPLNRDGEGKHTTTFVEMYDLPFGGAVVDIPGIKEFDLVDIEANELSHYFPEMLPLIHQCQYANCTHQYEPSCAIVEAVNNEIIDAQRYKNYLNMLYEIQQQRKSYSKK